MSKNISAADLGIHLDKRLADFDGIGRKTVEIFMRDARGVIL